MSTRLSGHLLAWCCLLAGMGAAYGFGYQRGVSWVLAPLGLAVLLNVIHDATPRRAAWLGYLYGAGFFGMGLNWTHTSLHVHGGLPLPLALAIALGFSLALALFPAVACGLGRWRTPARPTWIALLRLGAAWVILEHVRSWFLSGFGWLALGYSQVPHSPLAGFIPVVGTFGVTALCVLLAALIVLALQPAATKRQVLIPQSLAILLLLAGLGLKQVTFTTRTGEPLAVSVLQGAIPLHRQWLRANLTRIPQIYLDLARRAQGRLLVAPESALPFAWAEYPAADRQVFHDLLAQQDAALVLGSFDQDPGSSLSRNVAIVLHAAQQQTYAKRHLTPYGEYLPLAAWLEPVLNRARIPFSQLAPGTGDGTIELPFVTLGLSICYESLFPGLVSAPPAEVLVNITNDSWFDGSFMPAQHLQIAAARALEQGRWLIRSSNTGISAVIQPDGRVRRWLASGVRGTLNHTIRKRTGRTPYAWLGDWPTLAVAFLALFLLRRRSK